MGLSEHVAVMAEEYTRATFLSLKQAGKAVSEAIIFKTCADNNKSFVMNVSLGRKRVSANEPTICHILKSRANLDANVFYLDRPWQSAAEFSQNFKAKHKG